MTEREFLHGEPPPADREAPEGCVLRWVPDASLGSSPTFVALLPGEESKPCRMIEGAPRRYCRRPSVARMDRSRRAERSVWWHYCDRHLYGRILRDGLLWACIAVPVEEVADDA